MYYMNTPFKSKVLDHFTKCQLKVINRAPTFLNKLSKKATAPLPWPHTAALSPWKMDIHLLLPQGTQTPES